MNFYNFAPIRLLLTGAYWGVTHLVDLLTPFAGELSAALAIVVLTLVVRTLLIPVGVSQAKAQQTRARLAPKVAELNKRYKSQPEVLQQKMMDMYREEKASPLAGCLPMLAQMPVLMAVYGLFIQSTIGGNPNHMLTYGFFGVPLDTALIRGSLDLHILVVYGVIIGLLVVTAALTRRFLTPEMPATANGPDLSKVIGFMPFMTAFIAVIVPLAAGLYLLTTSIWTLCERVILKARFPAT